jgi:hypothetical protein
MRRQNDDGSGRCVELFITALETVEPPDHAKDFGLPRVSMRSGSMTRRREGSHIPNAPSVSAAVAWITIFAPKGVLARRSLPGKETTAFRKVDTVTSVAVAMFIAYRRWLR